MSFWAVTSLVKISYLTALWLRYAAMHWIVSSADWCHQSRSCSLRVLSSPFLSNAPSGMQNWPNLTWNLWRMSQASIKIVQNSDFSICINLNRLPWSLASEPWFKNSATVVVTQFLKVAFTLAGLERGLQNMPCLKSRELNGMTCVSYL